MNSNLNRALAAALAVFGSAAPALAQTDPDAYCLDPCNSAPYSPGFGFTYLSNQLFEVGIGVSGTAAYSSTCDAPNGAGAGPISGRIGFTVGPTGSIQDGILAANGQSVISDNFLRLTRGANFEESGDTGVEQSYFGPFASPAAGGNSYARVYQERRTSAGALVSSANFLISGFASFFEPQGGRSYFTDFVNATAEVQMVVDQAGDMARVRYTLINRVDTGTTNDQILLGLYYGMRVDLVDSATAPYPFGGRFVNFNKGFTQYITIPGRRPLEIGERFRNSGAGTTDGTYSPVPIYCNFSVNQADGYGIQVVNSPDALSRFDPAASDSTADQTTISGADQTPVDEFVVGGTKPIFQPGVVDGLFTTADPTFPDNTLSTQSPNGGITGAALAGDSGFIQKWLPRQVTLDTSNPQNGLVRNITAYYRTTTFDSNYSPAGSGYTIAVDSPRAITLKPGTISGTAPYLLNSYTLRVWVDNTGGFSNSYTAARQTNTYVLLTLPAGMTVTNAVKVGTQQWRITIPAIEPSDVAFVDFRFTVDPSVATGVVRSASASLAGYSYNITVQPQQNTGLSKSVTGSLNVAATPRLTLTEGLNLVALPWTYSGSPLDPNNPSAGNGTSWAQVLNLDPDSDFQVYQYDQAQANPYLSVSASTPSRGIGYWVVVPAGDSYPNRVLQGGAHQPEDQFPDPNNIDVGTGGTRPNNVLLRPGWNLVGNPYNYSFPVGQIIGLPADPGNNGTALTFAGLTSGSTPYTDGVFQRYDPGTGYVALSSSPTTRLQPNTGYWIFANKAFAIQFPPLFDLFIRAESAPEPTFKQRYNNWKLNLTATSSLGTDAQSFIGVSTTGTTRPSLRKAPAPLATKATPPYAFVRDASGGPMAQSLRNARTAQSFTYSVYSQNAGPVTVGWPNLKAIPSNLAVKVTDGTTGRSFDPRAQSSYTYNANAVSARTFLVSATPQSVARQQVGSIIASPVTYQGTKQLAITYRLSGRGSATVKIYRGNLLVSTVADDVDAFAGNNTVRWAQTDSAGKPVANGTYTLVISGVGEDGYVDTRTTSIVVRR